jgi:hypothetical protein
MRRSVDQILTTHAGSLTRPDALREAWSRPINDPKEETALRGRLQKSVVDIVASRSRRLMVDVGHSRLGGGLWPLDPSWSRGDGQACHSCCARHTGCAMSSRAWFTNPLKKPP